VTGAEAQAGRAGRVGRAGRAGLVTLVVGAVVGAVVLAGCSQAPTTTARPVTSSPPATVRGSATARPAGVWQPGTAQLPTDLAITSSSCTSVPRPEGWVRAEDDQPGDPSFAVPRVGMPGEILGYADRRSAGCGDTVAVALSGPNSTVQLEAYRVGAYRDAEVRLVWRSGDVQVQRRPVPPLQPGTNLREASWPVSVRVPITTAWPPGFYLLVAHAAGGLAGPAIPLVVRDDVDRTPVLFTASTLTWNAYNDFGGYSLYRGPGRTSTAQYLARSRVASFRRPLVGPGYAQLTFMDLPVVRELEHVAAASGVDVAYTTDVDVDQRPSQLLRHAEVVFGGHSEYWTRRAYDALAAARNLGVNVAFFGANNLWWHTRLDAAPGAVQPDREIVHRVAEGDPTPPSRSSDLTLLWSQWPERRDAAAMLGNSHAAISVHGGYQLLDAPAWLLDGTGLHAGTVDRPGSTLPLAVGNEADGYFAPGANPKDLTVVAAGVLRGSRGPVTASAGYYVAPSGAGVFAAGSTDWSCGLEGPCADQQVPEATSAALRGITRNVVLAFARPRAGLTHSSVPGVCPPPAVLLTRLDPAAVGTYGAGEVSEEGGKVRHAAVAPKPGPRPAPGPGPARPGRQARVFERPL